MGQDLNNYHTKTDAENSLMKGYYQFRYQLYSQEVRQCLGDGDYGRM